MKYVHLILLYKNVCNEISDKQNPIVVLLKSSNPSVSFTLCKHYEKDKRKIDNANTHVGWP